MKRISLLIALLLVIPLLSSGANFVFDAPCTTVAGCTPSTPGNDQSELGYLPVGGTKGTVMTSDRMYCWLDAADCTGNLGTAYFYADVASKTVRIAVYSTTDTNSASVPTNGTYVGHSHEITTVATDWASATMYTGSVTATTKYWLCLATSHVNYPTPYYDTGQSRHYISIVEAEYTDISGKLGSLPQSSLCTASATPYSCCTGNGTGCAWTTTTDRKNSIFVGIQ